MESEFEEEDAFTLVVVDQQLKKKKATWDTTRKRAYSEWIKGIELQKEGKGQHLNF